MCPHLPPPAGAVDPAERGVLVTPLDPDTTILHQTRSRFTRTNACGPVAIVAPVSNGIVVPILLDALRRGADEFRVPEWSTHWFPTSNGILRAPSGTGPFDRAIRPGRRRSRGTGSSRAIGTTDTVTASTPPIAIATHVVRRVHIAHQSHCRAESPPLRLRERCHPGTQPGFGGVLVRFRVQIVRATSRDVL